MTAQHSTAQQKLCRRFAFLSWPLDAIERCERLAQGTFPHLSGAAHKTRYPLRLLKYWWVACRIRDEAETKSSLKIADIGCGSCQMKMLAGDLSGAHWIGTDLKLNLQELAAMKYDEYFESDLTKTLPIDSESVDIVINSHVLEHLPNPDHSMSELFRVLKPGGLLLLGVPVSPSIVVPIQEMRYRREMAAGKRKVGDHVQAFSVNYLKDLIHRSGFSQIEMLTGTYFMRRQGFFLENYRWWVRVNQLWGALFPGLGQELCIAARKLPSSSST